MKSLPDQLEKSWIDDKRGQIVFFRILKTRVLIMKEVNPQIYKILGEKGNTSTFQNRVRGFSDTGCFLTPRKNLGLMTKEVKSYFSDSVIEWLMMKEVKTQIYKILGEKINTSTFENRVREFSDIGWFQVYSEKIWIDDKRGQIVFCRFWRLLDWWWKK